MPDTTGSGTHFTGPVGFRAGTYESLVAARTLVANDNGMTFGLNLVGGFTVTLPSIADAGAGWRCGFRVEIAPTTAYIITEKAADDTNVLTSHINELKHATQSAGPYNAAHTFVNFVAAVAGVGDYIDISCNGTRFFVRGETDADGGITLT